jgi:hypothetical protein
MSRTETSLGTTSEVQLQLRLRAGHAVPGPRSRTYAPTGHNSRESEVGRILWLSGSSLTTQRQHVKERLAGAFRIFALLGYDELIAGHITVRDPIDTQ